jgi:hypothetical protein
MGEVGEVGEVGDILPVKLLGRQPRLESLEAITSWYLVVASLKELNRAKSLVRNSPRVKSQENFC